MTTQRIFAALLTAALLIAGLAALSCAAPPGPLPTYTPYPTQSPLPTLTPFPTWTPAPTVTPYPTATAYPTPTALPTWTPAPTHTPYPTYTPAPTSAWPDWQTYRHNADRDDGGECDDRPNFEVELPPQWTTESADCDFAGFTSSDATLAISILDMPYYSASPYVALSELVKDYSGDYSIEGSGGTTWVTASRTVTMAHWGEPAIYQTVTFTPEPASRYCRETAHRLIMLSQSWQSHAQKAIVVILSRCESAQPNETDLMRILSSFRLVAPY